MEINCDINTILFRNHLIDKMKNFFYEFEKNKKNKLQKRGFYIHGISGTGKTEFAKYVFFYTIFFLFPYQHTFLLNFYICLIYNLYTIDSNILNNYQISYFDI